VTIVTFLNKEIRDKNLVKDPLISVLMPVFNAELFLKDSIESILNQTINDFEFIIINDGSTDSSLDIIQKYSKLDNRIKCYSRENRGLVDTLNHGIMLARGKWIARMDADDIAYPNRFSETVSMLNKSGAQICGSWIQILGGNYVRSIRYPESNRAIQLGLLFGTTFAHPTIFISSNLAKHNLYDRLYEGAEDYELWTRLSLLGVKMTNVQNILVKYRIHSTQISSIKRNVQQKLTKDIQFQYCTNYFKGNILLRKLFEKVINAIDGKVPGNYLADLNIIFVGLINCAVSEEEKSIIRANWKILFLKLAPISTHYYRSWSEASKTYKVGNFFIGLFEIYFIRKLRLSKHNPGYKFFEKIYLFITR
jgi:glycosyltransferase involved in cell wall biosynthesis